MEKGGFGRPPCVPLAYFVDWAQAWAKRQGTGVAGFRWDFGRWSLVWNVQAPLRTKKTRASDGSRVFLPPFSQMRTLPTTQILGVRAS